MLNANILTQAGVEPALKSAQNAVSFMEQRLGVPFPLEKGGCGAQSNELIRGPPELVQHFRLYRGSSHRRKSAAWHKFDMVWLYRSPIPVGRRRVFYSFI